MSYLNQKTLNKPIMIAGVGLHNGKKAKLVIRPAEPNTGIIFKRVDLTENNYVLPDIYNVSNTVLCTTISNEHGVSVSTVEHLMGALFGKGIDNVLIEVDNEEIPILDGSAKFFVNEIEKSGIKISDKPIKIIKVEKKVEYIDGVKSMSIEPNKISLDIDFEIKYENELIGTQRNLINVYEADLTEIYDSRTFCLYEDVEKLKKMNLAKGGSLDNAIVVDNKRIINEEGLRNKKEFVNHKILDCMGDLYLAGYKIVGKIICSQGGHKVTNELLRKFFNDKNNYSLIEIKEKNLPHTLLNKNFLQSIA